MNETANEKKPMPKGMWLLFSFEGRISRKTFWIFNGFVLLAGMLLGLITGPGHDINDIIQSPAHNFLMLWMLWPHLAIQAKRWHDQDKSALWMLLNLMPIFEPFMGLLCMTGPIWAFIANGMTPGTPGPNRFGPDPIEEAVTE